MNTLKQLIKDLSAEQTQLKSQRKTGTLPEWPRNSWGDVSWSDIPTARRIELKNALSAAEHVRMRKPRITAALNLYHELRGSDHKHGWPEHDYDYYNRYKKALRELREEFAVETVE